jgi:hypothetical protein
VPRIWPLVGGLIQQALKRGAVTPDLDIARRLADGSALLWLAWDGRQIHAAAVTELTSRNGRRVCTVVACGGRRRGLWLHLLRDLEFYAAAEDCSVMQMLGRPGWSRLLKDYRVTSIALEKELN